MDDFNEMLNSLMSDPKSFEMLESLAKQLSENIGSEEKKEEAPKAESIPDLSGISDITSLLSGLDPNLLSKAGALLGGFNSVETEKVNLLNSLKPYMSTEKSGRVEGAIRMMRILKMVRALGINVNIFGRR